MNFLVAAATSSLESRNDPPRKRVRPNLKVDTDSQSEIHTLLSDLISSLQPLTPVEHDIIHRAFYAGVAHESSDDCPNDALVFDENFSSNSSSLDLLAHVVYTQKQDARPALKRRFSEETFTIASLLHGMLVCMHALLVHTDWALLRFHSMPVYDRMLAFMAMKSTFILIHARGGARS